MKPFAWTDCWKHDIVNARSDDSLLPLEAREFLVLHGLPSVVIFECRNSFEISFAPLAKQLTCYNRLVRWGDFYNEALDQEWARQVVIGEEEFCNGHASFCVHQRRGDVSRIDCELSARRSSST